MNIFHKLSELTSGNHTYQEVATELERLRNSGKPVTIRLEGDPKAYATRITAFNKEHKVFVLSNLFPPVQDDTFYKGRTATISSTENGKTVSLNGLCLEPLVNGANMGYELKVSSALTITELENNNEHSSQNFKAVDQERKAVGM